jgi:hypothetical protein
VEQVEVTRHPGRGEQLVEGRPTGEVTLLRRDPAPR